MAKLAGFYNQTKLTLTRTQCCPGTFFPIGNTLSKSKSSKVTHLACTCTWCVYRGSFVCHTSHVDHPKMVNPSCFTWLCTLRESFVFVSLQQHCDFNGKGSKAFKKAKQVEKCLQASTVGWDKDQCTHWRWVQIFVQVILHMLIIQKWLILHGCVNFWWGVLFL